MDKPEHRVARIQRGAEIIADYRAARRRIQQCLDEMDAAVDRWLEGYESEATEAQDLVRLEARQVELAKLLTAYREIENLLLEESVNVNEILRTNHGPMS